MPTPKPKTKPKPKPRTHAQRIAAQLRRLREREGLSLNDLSDRCGMERMMIQRIETGKVPDPRLSTLATIAKGLGYSVDVTLTPSKSRRAKGAVR